MRRLVGFAAIVVCFLAGCSTSDFISSQKRDGVVITNQSDHHVFVDYHSSMLLFVEASGQGELSYQWKVSNGPYGEFVDVIGATGATYTKSSVEREDNGMVYLCVVSDDNGSVESGYMIIMVDKVPPIMVTQPEDVSVNIGETIYLYAESDGSQPIDPVWKKNGIAIEGATSSLLQIDNASIFDAGEYTCEMSNEWGSVVTRVAIVEVK